MNLKEFSKEIVESVISSNPSSMKETIKDLEYKLEEYADQFKPKWISTNNLHHVNMKVKMGWYALMLTDEFGIIHQDIKHIKHSIPTRWHFYCPVILPEKPQENG